MHDFICNTCGTQFPSSASAPAACPICVDERQYVGWQGQTWTHHAELAGSHRSRIEREEGLLALGVTPSFAIDQRAFVLKTDAGNIMWECLPLVTPEALRAIEAEGGVDRIVISHPHFYASMVEWSEVLGGVPITIHAADRAWVQRKSSAIEHWEGDKLALSDAVTLVRCGGHFPGSTALHWQRGPERGAALFPGDALQVARDRQHLAFLYSYPNMIPMRRTDVIAMRDRLVGYEIEDIFGYTWGLNIIGGGRAAVDRSFARFLEVMA